MSPRLTEKRKFSSQMDNWTETQKTVFSPVYTSPAESLWLYQQECLKALDTIAEKYPDGCFDMIR
jgi:hypothetical protein